MWPVTRSLGVHRSYRENANGRNKSVSKKPRACIGEYPFTELRWSLRVRPLHFSTIVPNNHFQLGVYSWDRFFFLSKSATVCLFGGLLYLYVVNAYNVLPKSIKLTLKVISLSAINERVPWWKNELARQWFGRNRTIWFMYLVTTPGILVCRQFLYYIVWTLILFAMPLKLALAQIQPSSWIIVVTRDEYFIKPTTGWRAFRSCAIIKLLQETIYYFL